MARNYSIVKNNKKIATIKNTELEEGVYQGYISNALVKEYQEKGKINIIFKFVLKYDGEYIQKDQVFTYYESGKNQSLNQFLFFLYGGEIPEEVNFDEMVNIPVEVEIKYQEYKGNIYCNVVNCQCIYEEE